MPFLLANVSLLWSFLIDGSYLSTEARWCETETRTLRWSHPAPAPWPPRRGSCIWWGGKLVEKTSNNKSFIDPSCPKWLSLSLQFAAWLAAGCRGLLISSLVSDYAALELSNVGVMCSVLTILTTQRNARKQLHGEIFCKPRTKKKN